MNTRGWFFVMMVGLTMGSASNAAVPSDVPKTLWAYNSVKVVIDHGVMAPSQGTFDGKAFVSRTELAITLEKFAKSLEAGRWKSVKPIPLSGKANGDKVTNSPLTRYQLAAVLARIGGYAAQGLPASSGKSFGASEALPPAPKLTGIDPKNPAFKALSYLAVNRMVSDKSVLLKPGKQPVTQAEAAKAVSQVVLGLTDKLTDEPQNREEIQKPK